VTNQTLYLHAEDPDEVRRATQVIAELVRQGLTFEARTDVVTGVSGLNAVHGIVVTLTGGY
jgi:non-canonical (house-cleaning) NTP pyrophosphatase